MPFTRDNYNSILSIVATGAASPEIMPRISLSLTGGRDGEFRVFLPVVDEDDMPEELKAYADAVARVIDDFTAVDGRNKDAIDITEMLYCVGDCHWGIKYRGASRNLEVKYRKTTMEVGECGNAIEMYKKKKFGNVSLKNMKKKIMEKLTQHCGDQHGEQQQKYAAEAIDAERLIGLDKRRKAYQHGGVAIDFGYIDINLSKSTFHKKALGGESADSVWRDSLVLKESPQDDGASKAEHDASDMNTKGGKWVSVCFEGGNVEIIQAIRSNFDPIATAIAEGLKVGVPVMVGGYPTFVNLVGNGLTYGNDCDEGAYGLYNSTIKGPTEALLAFHAANREGAEDHQDGETNAYFFKGSPRIQLT